MLPPSSEWSLTSCWYPTTTSLHDTRTQKTLEITSIQLWGVLTRKVFIMTCIFWDGCVIWKFRIGYCWNCNEDFQFRDLIHTCVSVLGAKQCNNMPLLQKFVQKSLSYVYDLSFNALLSHVSFWLLSDCNWFL